MSKPLLLLVSCSLMATISCDLDEADVNPSTGASSGSHLRANGAITPGDQLCSDVSTRLRSAEVRTGGPRGAHDPGSASKAMPSDCSLGSTTIRPEYDPVDIYEIPVVFHIISRSDSAGDIPDALILSQLDVLNEDFRAMAGTPGENGTDSRIRFVMASIDPMGMATTGIERVTDDNYYSGMNISDMKMALNWDPDNYLNIYTVDLGALSESTHPQQEAGTEQDGIVLNHTNVGRDAPGASPFDQGRSGTHAAGIYLGLLHTFQGGCGSIAEPYTTGDLIADTNPEQSPNLGCPMPGTQASMCPGGGFDPTDNYMDFTDDMCMQKFTVEQINRMRCALINYRPQLYDVININQSPTADFTYTVNGLTIDFTDTSTDPDGAVESWGWDFGDGNSATAQSPSHSYAADGTYTVTLIVTDDQGDTDNASMDIDVAAPITPDAGGPVGIDIEYRGGGCSITGDEPGGIALLIWLLGAFLVCRDRSRHRRRARGWLG